MAISQYRLPASGLFYFREPFLAASHLLGSIAGIVGSILLLSSQEGSPFEKSLIFGIYGLSLVILFLVSGLLHGLHCSKESSLLLEKLDHAAIYLFIAASYTPVCFYLGESTHFLVILQWVLAIFGIILIFFSGIFAQGLTITIFMLLGWNFVWVINSIWVLFSSRDLLLLISGILFYSGGALLLFFRPQTICNVCTHAVWHVCVLFGAFSHFVMMWDFYELMK